MTSVLTAVRPDSWNFPLVVQVLGAMVLVGGLLTATSVLAFARGDARFLRLGYWTLVAVALPGYIVMRVGAEWIYSREGWDDLPDAPTWLDLGYIIADLRALLVLVSLILGGIGIWRLRDGRGAGLLKATMVMALIVLAAAVVAIWAMAGRTKRVAHPGS